MNPLSSRKRTSSSRSNLVTFIFWIYWTFLAEQQALILSWRHTELQGQKVSSPTNGLITVTKCRIQNFPHMTPFTVNFVASTLLKPNTWNMLTYSKVGWPQNKPLSNWNCQSHPLQEMRNYHYLQQIRKQEQMSSFRHFLRWYNNKDVVPTLEAMQKMIFLPRQRYRYGKDWLYFTKRGQDLLTQIYWRKMLSIHGKRWKPYGEISIRCCWWSLYGFFTQSSLW